MIKWYYFLSAQLLVLAVILLALLFPWYSMEHITAGGLYGGRRVYASGEMETVEMMTPWESKRQHSATSSPYQIFRSPRSTYEAESYDDKPHIEGVMSKSRNLCIAAEMLGVVNLILIGAFLFIRKKRKSLRIALIASTMLLVISSFTGVVLFYQNMPNAVYEDLDSTIFPDIFDHMEEENITLPDELADQNSTFHSTRTEVYHQFKNETQYSKSFSGTSTDKYYDSFLHGSVILNVRSVLSWGPSFGWYMMIFASIAGIALVILSFQIDKNTPVPFRENYPDFDDYDDDNDNDDYDDRDDEDDDDYEDHSDEDEDDDPENLTEGYIPMEGGETNSSIIELARHKQTRDR